MMPSAVPHPGLVWRFAGAVPDPGDPKVRAQVDAFREDHVGWAAQAARDAVKPSSAHGVQYRLAFQRRQAWLAGRAACRSIRIAGRLETGVGEPGVFECQVALHPLTGLPRLVGSGLKGLLAAWCFERWDLLARENRAAAEAELPRATLLALFGNRPDTQPQQAGLLTVHDAWWDPGPATPAPARGPLEMERSTSHHPPFYAGVPGAQATDLDSPNPVPRIAVAGTLHFALDHDGIGEAWASQCLTWLHLALADTGAGASRSLGYGRFAPPV